jgi:hypothetical protein
MSTQGAARYTAKLSDGPLEGKTISVDFLDTGEPKPSIGIPSGGTKTYIYARTSDVEFDREGSDRPTAVAYRFRTTSFD